MALAWRWGGSCPWEGAGVRGWESSLFSGLAEQTQASLLERKIQSSRGSVMSWLEFFQSGKGEPLWQAGVMG